MIKIIGAILLVCGAALIGLSASAGLSARARSLAGMAQALDVMRSEIGERLSPLEEVMRRLSKISAPPLGDFFLQCAEEMRSKPDIPFGLIWTKQLARAENLRLNARETEELSSLGNVLGRYSAEEQRASIEHAARCIDSMAASAERDRARLGMLYTKLGFICGISVVIVFI